ncbi:DNA polymerase III subunit alpha, partial [Escherichia coli]|nr:DNA polymerase III subunit alpha [Escherichia coli]EJO9114687.1 DNA polymerase III subunit alpha [Escherichia coli]
GAGSLVAYSLKITNLDPLPYGLLFERFLNPERVSMPDFDIDFESTRREDVIRYVREKYDGLSGTHSVSQIATYGLLKPKAVLKDVGRTLQMNYMEVDSITKTIPNDPKITLTKMMDLDDASSIKHVADKEAFIAKYEGSKNVKRLVDLAMRLENVPKSVGKHAGGVVIAPGKLTDFAPLYVSDESEGMLTCQYDGAQIEHAGLVKFDFLALSNLTVIEKAVMDINKKAEFKDKEFDIDAIPLDDKKVFDNIFANGNAIGVFQFESSGMRGMLKSIKPDTFEDLIALVSLYRPGPMALIPDYARRKAGEPFEYIDKRLEPVLKETYGIFIYQEQVMKAAQVIADYSLGGADLLRRAMGKKKKEEMAKERIKFRDGAQKNGLSGEKADEIFDLMETFADYGFNKSHAAAYSLVAYQTAYLKTYYPAEFYAAFLNVEGAEKSKLEKVELLVKDARKNGINMLPPDVNVGNALFITENGLIRYGMAGLKGVSEIPLNIINKEREENGNFTSFYDFCRRLAPTKVGKSIIEKLI